VYARGILRVCESYLESPLECVAGVTGANLKRRIEQIMKRRIVQKLTGGKKLMLAAAGMLAIAGPFVIGLMNALPARAQATRSADTPGFEVSAVRPCSPADPVGRSSEPIGHGTLKVSCMTVIDFMQSAYVSWANGHLNSPKWLRIEGGPAWIKSERYTINAKSQADAPFEMLTGPMLQLLLEDRFKLKTHRETREIPVYALTVAKSGPKLKPVAEGSCTPSDQFSVEKFLAMGGPDQKLPDLCGTTKGGPSPSGNGFTIARDFHGMTLAQFGRALPLDRPVTDKTGIAGMFDFHLEFAIDDTTRSAVPPNSPAAALASDPSGPSIFTALQEQLGLKLEPAKGPGEFLVIDSVEHPSQN
jgi:bla regulator protein blaR1